MTFHSKNSPEVADVEQIRIAQQAADWFAKLRNEKISDEDWHRFNQWLSINPAHQKAYGEIQGFWNDPKFSQTLKSIPLSRRRIKRSRYSSNAYRIAVPLMAASFVLAVIMLQSHVNCLQADYCTGIGEMRDIQLTDGSRVMMNSQTALQVSFQDNLRLIRLVQGEAYFEVQHNPNRPFVVEGHYSQTRVVGTRFIVRENERSDTVTVNGGVVEVRQNQLKPYVLHVNDQVSVGEENSNGIQQVSPVTTGAWTKGHLVFENSTLANVIDEIDRYRKGTVIIKNSHLKAIKVSGRFDIGNPDKALEALEQTLPIKVYRLTPWLVVIA